MKRFTTILLMLAVYASGFAQNLSSSNALYNDAFRLAMWTIDNNTDEAGLLKAGGNYGGEWTRDISINSWNAASQLRPDIAEYSLWSVTNNHQSIGHQYWDKIIWVIAAWNHYLVTGREAFLKEAYDCCKASMTQLEDSVFDSKYGLFMGPAVFQDGIAAYDEPIYDPAYDGNSYVLDHPNSGPMKCLSTNCVYYEAYKTLALMGKQLKASKKEVKAFEKKATVLRHAILTHLYDKERNHFYYLVDHNGKLHDYQEGLGIAYAVLFNLIDDTASRKMLAQCDISPSGIVTVAPSFPRNTPEKPGRHNMMVWPHVNMFYASACAKAGDMKQFWFEMNNLTDLVLHKYEDNLDSKAQPGKPAGNFHEIYTVDGVPSGGWQCSKVWPALNHQTWCATGYVRNFLYYIIGMKPDTNGLSFSPIGMEDGSAITLKDISYRNATLDITVTGKGNRVKSCTINGKPSKPFIPANAEGKIDIKLEVM